MLRLLLVPAWAETAREELRRRREGWHEVRVGDPRFGRSSLADACELPAADGAHDVGDLHVTGYTCHGPAKH